MSEIDLVKDIFNYDDSLEILLEDYVEPRVKIIRVIVENGNRSERLIYMYRESEFTLQKMIENIRVNLTKSHFIDYQIEDRKYLYSVLAPYNRNRKIKELLDE